MSYTNAGSYGPEAILARVGASSTVVAAPTTPVTVYLKGTTTKASLWTDRTKATAGANPVTTDTGGNLQFFADPGYYDINYAPPGGVAVTQTVFVPLDAEDPQADQFGSNYVLTTTANSTYPSAFLPEKYGAKGDGATSDTAAIQAAIDAAFAAGGGDVFFGPKTYAIGGWAGAASNVPALYALRLKTGVRLRGSGFATILKPTSGPATLTQGIFIGNDQTNGLSDMQVCDLAIDMSAITSTSYAVGVGFGNPYGGATAATRSSVNRCKISGVPYVGIRLTSGCSQMTISNNTVFTVGFIGIQVDATTNSQVVDNHVYSTTNNCIDLSGDTGSGSESSSTYNVVSGNVVSGSSATGIFIETCSHTSVIGNTVGTCAYGIYVNRTNSLTHNNAIVGNVIGECTTAGIQINGQTNDTTIASNSISVPASKVGIIINASPRGTIAANNIRGQDGAHTADGIQFASSANTWSVCGNSITSVSHDINVISGSSINASGNMVEATTMFGIRLGTGGSEPLGFYGQPGVAVHTGTPAAATDLASVIALANHMRTTLLNLTLSL